MADHPGQGSQPSHHNQPHSLLSPITENCCSIARTSLLKDCMYQLQSTLPRKIFQLCCVMQNIFMIFISVSASLCERGKSHKLSSWLVSQAQRLFHHGSSDSISNEKIIYWTKTVFFCAKFCRVPLF